MKCPRCQAQNREGVRFCEECGARLELTCPGCGAPVVPGKKFCGACGATLVGQTADRPAPPQAYTPRHLAEKILTSRGALEGERKQVTVLFADLKGSMELLAERDPEDARKLLDPILERMMEAVHRYEGTVNQVMGDGIMALFGAPLAHEDHAVRACYAALRMQETVSQYGDELQRSHGVPIQIRVGLNSGEVVVRSIGSDLHMDYTAVGQTTHLAARMEQVAKPGSVLITANTLNLAEGYVEVRPLGPVAVKGLEAPVEVFQLTGAGPVRSRLQAAAGRGFSRFVGRAAELEQLARALEQVRAGHGQVVAVVGEPGVGKSRLFYEFTRSHRTRDCVVLESASVSYGKATAYLPTLDLLKRYLKIEDRDDARAIREKVTGKILTLDPTLEETIQAVLALLEALPEDHPFLALDPPKRRQRTLDSLKRLFLRESQVEPLVLVFEDLHWIDAETQALLDGLIESLPTSRVFLAVNYRPEFQHGWGGKTYYTQLRIDPLPAESAGELLHALVGSDPSLDPLKRFLVERTEGNPFFLEESVRTLVETQVLAGERGAYRLGKTLPGLQVPATVQAILAARIDRLPPEEKQLLQSASVIGKDVPRPLLQAITDLPEDALGRGLSHLQAGEFLYEARLFPEIEYTFKHALTHEVAYTSLLQEPRRDLHARIAEAIERLYPDRLAEHVERLAHHAGRGEAWDKAHGYWRQAGAKALARSTYREAVGCFEQALEAVHRLPETRETVERAIDLRFDLRNPLHALGELGRLLELLHEAEALAEKLGDQRRLGRARSHMVQFFWLTGKNAEAVVAANRALAMAAAIGDAALEAATSFYLGEAHHALGGYREAAAALGRAVALSPSHGHLGLPGSLAIHTRAWLALCLAELGDFADGLEHAQEAMRLAETADRSFDIVTASFALGYSHVRQGQFARAVTLLERALGLVRAGGFQTWVGSVTATLGYALALSGRLEQGLTLLEEAMPAKRSYFRLRLVFASEASARAGRHPAAVDLARRALELSRARGERGHEAWSVWALAEAVASTGPRQGDNAEGHYREALRLAEELGMRPLEAHCHLGLGRLCRRAQRHADAEAHLAAAAALFRDMQMRPWLEEVEAEVKASG